MILDTNGLSAIAEGNLLLSSIAERADEICLPAIVLGEYLFGIQQSRNRVQYEQWLDESLPLFRVLAVDEATAYHYADIRLELKRAGLPFPGSSG